MRTLPLSEAKTKLSALLKRLGRDGQDICITKSGRAAAILVSPHEYESLKETAEILSDPSLMADIRKGMKSLAAGKSKSYTVEELDALLGPGE